MKHLLFILILLPAVATAQNKVKRISGSLRPLKGVKSYNIIFTYDSMLVGQDVPEEKYLADKKVLWEQKQPGKGDEIYKLWFDYRKLYEPSFKQSFRLFSTVGIDDANAKYTLILKTKHTEGGWFGGAIAKPAQVSGLLVVVETADMSKVVATLYFMGSGDYSYGGDAEMFERIKSAYLITGKALGEFWKEKAL